MMILHADRLSSSIQTKVLEAIQLGLDEIRRLDVLVAYTNITVLDILNSCLGGELLGDEAIAQRGYQKLLAWMALTDQQGHPFEYNSPTYSVVTIRALKQLVDWVKDDATRIRAKTTMNRLGLSAALHIHPKTGRWAGPHSRAYHPSVVGEREPEIEIMRNWIADGTLPPWAMALIENRPAALTVHETAHMERHLGLTTYHGDSFALGVTAAGSGGQANVLLAQYPLSQSEPSVKQDGFADFISSGPLQHAPPGVFFTRYLLNNKWLGDSYHATDRTKSRNLMDEGDFLGVQDGARAIGLYAPKGDLGLCSSAKGALVWTQRSQIDEIWIGEQRVDHLPAVVSPGDTVVVGTGEILMAIHPLTISNMGQSAPIRLVERDDSLVLELVNYDGPEKHFWESRWPGAFYQGKAQCGFYVELAERSDYPNGLAFAQEIERGEWEDETASPFTYAGEGERLWRVSYTRDGETFGIEIDLMEWQLKRRWNRDDELGWPMLESPVARQNRYGRIEVGQATLECGQEAAWLVELPDEQGWVAGYHGPTPAPLKLTTPEGTISLASIETGMVTWQNGQVEVDAIGVEGAPVIHRI